MTRRLGPRRVARRRPAGVPGLELAGETARLGDEGRLFFLRTGITSPTDQSQTLQHRAVGLCRSAGRHRVLLGAARRPEQHTLRPGPLVTRPERHTITGSCPNWWNSGRTGLRGNAGRWPPAPGTRQIRRVDWTGQRTRGSRGQRGSVAARAGHKADTARGLDRPADARVAGATRVGGRPRRAQGRYGAWTGPASGRAGHGGNAGRWPPARGTRAIRRRGRGRRLGRRRRAR